MNSQKTKIPVKALIFDMDGTMIDNMMIHHRAWQKKLQELGLEMTLEDVKRDIHGVNNEIIKRLFDDRFTDKEVAQIAWDKEAAYREIYADQIKLLPGLQEFLDTAKELGIPMGIGTAAPKENAEFAMEALELQPYFKTVVHSDMVARGKPDPQVFKMVADDLNINLKDCLIFEDSPTGAQAAANGNSKSIILTTTHTQDEFSSINGIQTFIKDYKTLSLIKDENRNFYLQF
ncbi:HAD family hydrolase [Leeuwenhoekiella marinoflava]|uniref:HAD superfamily hydrolase (TIGR01509 family) n=2 Tax=Leeuwenhoekiella marinoflava TaxID=988 RepID=A0A4Q0PLP4_9FLAO|nr:HAD family phosphatase [Leeuwenhoekiella marinoflava]RXG29981.1 HAD superfamily hydrolase (TIGR01509 family) [Leeuwenhoekiella marinoflava]SHF24496.1 haloacid dehalogenase superfamily, subfamily IA, variant 3 with third motif having DD or ED [Leeuwenhoekiella marinoflava DSM 3653]